MKQIGNLLMEKFFRLLKFSKIFKASTILASDSRVWSTKGTNKLNKLVTD